jgi:HD-GYP domain-containing protein (c-di-GMP phosphodiesterase class II)
MSSDVSTSKHLNAEAYQRLILLEAVNRISTALRVADQLDAMVALLAQETQAVIDAAAVTIWLYNSERDELHQVAAAGFPNLNVRLKPGVGIAGQVFVSGQAYISREFKTDPRTHESARLQVPAGLAGAAIPIRTSHETIGVLFVSVLLPRELTADQIRVLTTIAEIAGIAIHRMRLHELTERRLQRITALQTIHLAISASLDLPVTLNILLDQVLAQLQADAADILLFNPSTQTLDCAAARGFRNVTNDNGKRSIALGAGIAGRAAIERRIVTLPNLAAAPDPTLLPHFADDKFVTCFAAPLIARGQIIGVLEIFHRTLRDPNPEWFDFLHTLAELATIAIGNATQFENLGRANLALGVAFDAAIESCARALDRREGEPDGHAASLADLTVRLATALGVPAAQLQHIRRGALLHDIGKLGVPETILQKPDRLNAKEWIEIRKHSVYAYELLAPVEYLHPALAIPYCHHEKWDGTGYPNGLKGEAIPLAARIFAVVDIWDALNSARPYRAAWPPAKILKRLKTLAGTHLDPQCVARFLELLDARA